MSLGIITAFAALLISVAGVFVTAKYPVRPVIVTHVLLIAPTLFAFLYALTDMSFGSIVGWLLVNPVMSTALLFGGALLPIVIGMTLDAPCAYVAYRKRFGAETRPTFAVYRRISKYGHVDFVVDGAGRFDFEPRHVLFALGCNMLGAACVVSLIWFACTIPGLDGFIRAHHRWLDFMALLPGVALLLVLVHINQQQMGPRPSDIHGVRENPDNALLSRFHVIANTVYLMVAITVLVSLLSAVTAYCYSSGGGFELNPLFLLFMALTLLFLWFSSVSGLAKRYESKSSGLWVNGLVFAIIAALVVVVGPFRFSAVSVCAIAICMLAALFSVRERLPRLDVVSTFPAVLLVIFLVSVSVYFVC